VGRSTTLRTNGTSSAIVATGVLAMVMFGALVKAMSAGGPVVMILSFTGVLAVVAGAMCAVRWLERAGEPESADDAGAEDGVAPR
jgi:hypothetical protein